MGSGNTLRAGLIGLGNVALGGHLPGWKRRRDVEIVAVTDVDPARRSTAATELPAARWYDSPDEMFASASLDFVDICTPPSSHAALIDAALARGLHVLCEKPLVVSLAELERVSKLAGDTDRVLHSVHNWHYAPIVERTAELVRSGAIGAVTRIVWRTLRTKPATVSDEAKGNWRLDPTLGGGGILTDHGWHVFYLVPRWIGERPTSVRARLETRRHTEAPVEDTATVQVTFPRASAEIFLTWAAAARESGAELRGTEGTLALEDDTLVLERDGRRRRWSCPPGLSAGSVHPDWFDAVASRFVGEVTNAMPRDGNLEEAALCALLECLARESSQRGGQPIAVPALPIPVR